MEVVDDADAHAPARAASGLTPEPGTIRAAIQTGADAARADDTSEAERVRATQRSRAARCG